MRSELRYAPASRLRPHTSHVIVDFAFGGVLFLLAMLAAAMAWRSFVRASALRAEVWKQRGLRPGLMLIGGIAEPIDEEKQAAASQGAAFAPFVELTIHQYGVQHSSRNGRYVVWTETSRALTERPFLLRTEAGTAIRVEPTGQIDLVDRLEEPIRTGVERKRIARIVPGEHIFVRGELWGAGGDRGPYRGGGNELTLRPPRGAPLLICSQPVDAEEAGNARFHGVSSAVLLALLAVCQLAIFSTYRTLRHGVESTSTITDMRTFITRNKNTITHHFAFTLEPSGREVEVSERAYELHRIGDMVPIVRAPLDPSALQVGDASEVGITMDNFVFAGLLSFAVLLGWSALTAKRKPWWRKKALVEKVSGTL